MTRVACRLPRTTGTAPCSRCLDVIDVRAGCWIAAEPDGPAAICDTCSERDDPAGFAMVDGFRRMAHARRVLEVREGPMTANLHETCERCGTPLVWHGDLLICPRRGCGQPEAVTSRSRPLHGDVASGAQR